MKDTDTVTVSFKIKNTGSVDGAEIAEVYVADKESTISVRRKSFADLRRYSLKQAKRKRYQSSFPRERSRSTT